ncbi:MAG: hypothetical protein E7638_08815 [Ruminococcaceae bacterium]|nr:hypothetical protein [Oscillospiraceae bacterium]
MVELIIPYEVKCLGSFWTAHHQPLCSLFSGSFVCLSAAEARTDILSFEEDDQYHCRYIFEKRREND